MSIFQAIYNFINSIINFLYNAIVSLFVLISKIPTYISFITTSINVLPSVLIPFCIASIMIYVIYLIVDRSH